MQEQRRVSWMRVEERQMLDVHILCAVAISENLLEHFLQISFA